MEKGWERVSGAGDFLFDAAQPAGVFSNRTIDRPDGPRRVDESPLRDVAATWQDLPNHLETP